MKKTRSLRTNLHLVLAAGWRFSLLLALLLSAPLGSAHQQKTAVTRVLFNPNTNNIEVMHRFFVHDAEHAATLIFGERQTLVESAESRQLFSSYVINRFAIVVSLSDGSEQELPLQYVGEEIDGQFMWVYQEIANREDIDGMSIINVALRDVWPDQSNLVNIERAGEIFSLTFEGNDEQLSVDFTS
ncbi:MAG: hypothetical protein MI746_03195 [Pseudomonadales bacterium]|nr:hypothetical protein [Pseudomonadales bacterium]